MIRKKILNTVLIAFIVGPFLFLVSIFVFIIANNTYGLRDFVLKMNKNESAVINSLEEVIVDHKIIFISDIESDFEMLEALITKLGDTHVDAIIVTGDITHLGAEDDMTKIRDILNRIDSTIIYYVPGDRDLWESGTENFEKIFGAPYQFINIAGFNLLLIDNSDEYKGISAEQFEFIKENIDTADFVVLHNPIFFEGSPLSFLFHKGMGQYSNYVEEQRVELLSLIRDSNVKAVFAGDQHIFSVSKDTKDDNLYHYVVGSLNRSRSLSSPSYIELGLSQSGKYKVSNLYLR